MQTVKSKKKIILIAVLTVFLMGISAFTIYVSDYYNTDNNATVALTSTGTYSVMNSADSINPKWKQNQNRNNILPLR